MAAPRVLGWDRRLCMQGELSVPGQLSRTLQVTSRDRALVCLGVTALLKDTFHISQFHWELIFIVCGARHVWSLWGELSHVSCSFPEFPSQSHHGGSNSQLNIRDSCCIALINTVYRVCCNKCYKSQIQHFRGSTQLDNLIICYSYTMEEHHHISLMFCCNRNN